MYSILSFTNKYGSQAYYMSGMSIDIYLILHLCNMLFCKVYFVKCIYPVQFIYRLAAWCTHKSPSPIIVTPHVFVRSA